MKTRLSSGTAGTKRGRRTGAQGRHASIEVGAVRRGRRSVTRSRTGTVWTRRIRIGARRVRTGRIRIDDGRRNGTRANDDERLGYGGEVWRGSILGTVDDGARRGRDDKIRPRRFKEDVVRSIVEIRRGRDDHGRRDGHDDRRRRRRAPIGKSDGETPA